MENTYKKLKYGVWTVVLYNPTVQITNLKGYLESSKDQYVIYANDRDTTEEAPTVGAFPAGNVAFVINEEQSKLCMEFYNPKK